MDSREAIRNMRKDLAEIEKVLAWLERSNETQEIDKDVLLNRTRNLYNQFLNLPVGPFELPSEPPAGEANPLKQSNPQAAPPTQSRPPGERPHPPKQPEQPKPNRPAPEPEREPDPETFPSYVRVQEPEPEQEPEQEPEWEPESEPESEPERYTATIQRPKHDSKPEPKPDYFDLPYQPPIPRTQKSPVRKTDSDNNPLPREGRLNEALGRKNPVHDLASSIVEIPVADIWSAITINERFLFIRELFGNDPEGFKSTVTLLNSLDSWESAKQLMANRFDWDKNNPVAVSFLNIVRRRFLR